MRRNIGAGVVWALGGLALVFLSLPVVALALRAVANRAWEGVPGSALPDAIWLSFITPLATLTVTVVFGTPLAYLLARRKFPLKRWLSVLVELPIVLPPAVAG